MGERAVRQTGQTSLFEERQPVDSIADQVHQLLVEQEEDRCLQAEKKRRQKGPAKQREPLKRRRIPIPTVRGGPVALCQNSEYLLMVHNYDYDLSSEAFRVYCQERGTLSVAGQRGSSRWAIFADHQRAKDAYLQDPDFQFGQVVDGVKRAYSPAEMESGWSVIRYGRATLQDSWELFQAEVKMRFREPRRHRKAG